MSSTVTAFRLSSRVLKSRVRIPPSYSFTRCNVVPSRGRLFASTTPSAAFATEPVARPTTSILVYSPSPEHLEEQEIDVELLPTQDIMIDITERAAEQLRKISARESNRDAALRIAVESGGCHGYQYKMELATCREPDDYHLSHPTLKPSNIFVDAVSMPLLNGSTIDFATELIGSSFRVIDNPQAQGSGCGCGVSWELKQ